MIRRGATHSRLLAHYVGGHAIATASPLPCHARTPCTGLADAGAGRGRVHLPLLRPRLAPVLSLLCLLGCRGDCAARTEADARVRQPRVCPSCHHRLAQRGGRVGWGAGCVSLFCGMGVHASSMPFLLPPRHPCCTRLWGNGRTTEGRGCEHDRARPPYKTPVHPTFRMPPCARRPACGTTRAGHSKGGVRRDLVRGTTRGRAHTRCGRGVPAPILAAPPIAPVRAPLPVHARMGAPLCTPFTQAGRGQKRWGGGYASCASISVPH